MASDTLTSVAPVHRFILLTDIAQSSRLAEQYPSQYKQALAKHNKLTEQTVASHSGEVYKHMGDGYFVLFDTAEASVACAAELAPALAEIPPLAENEPLLVRLALHAGELQPSGREYFGPALNRTSRICQICHPGQVLLSGAVASTVGKLADDARLQDLGQHHLRDLAAPEQLYQLDSARFSRHDFPPLSTLDNRPNNLVEQPNAFIGRERELKELAELLLDDTRLLSITAPGGYGKSRLAAQLFANLLHRFENGVFMVYLAPVRDSSLATTVIANALGYQFTAGRTPEQQLCDYLRAKELLLCLDNFEHVMDSAPLVAELLQAAPKLKIAVTSREPLRLEGEYIYRLEPLSVEIGADGYSDAELLFADRAALVKQGYALTAENAAQVRHFCEHLSGIPLAIELAAAWMDGFTLEELHDELSSRLELAARTSNKPQRHQSLQACLDWSWQLLGEQQQTNLMKLATFRGGFFSDAASGVLGTKGMPLRSALLKLCDKSWLYARDVSGRTRFYLRDMLAHEYAFARLENTRGAEDSLFEQAVGAHAAYYAALAEREGPRLNGGGTPDGGAAQLAALLTWRIELDNILEALDTALSRNALPWLITFARYLQVYLERISDYYTLRDRYSLLLDSAQAAGHDGLLTQARIGLGRAQWRLGNYSVARELTEQALALSRQLGDRNGEAGCLSSLGNVENDQGDFSAARSLFIQALALNRELGKRSGEAGCLNSLGSVEIYQGNHSSARELLEQSVQLNRELGDRHGEAGSLNGLGITEFLQGNFNAAQVLFTQGLELFQELASRNYEAYCLTNLGNVASMLGNYGAAKTLLERSLTLQNELGDRNGEATCLNILGGVEYLLGNYCAAQALFEQTLELCRELRSSRHVEASCLVYLGIVKYMQGNYTSARAQYEQALELYQKLGNNPETAATCAIAGAVIAALDRPDLGALAIYGGQHAAAGLDHKFDPQSQQMLDSGLARLDAAVADGTITADELKQRQATAAAMSLDELAELVLAELAKLNDVLQEGEADQQAGA